MKHKLLLSISFFIVLIIGISFMSINIKKPLKIEYKTINSDSAMLKFELEQKPVKQIPYKQETQKRYTKLIYEHFDKIDEARDRQLG